MNAGPVAAPGGSWPAVAFPGQGIQPAAVASALAAFERDPRVRALLGRLGGRSAADLDFSDTRAAQPAIYLCGLLRAFDETGGPGGRGCGVPLAMGHSLGDLTALAYAGGVEPEIGLELAVVRGELFHRSQRRRPGALAVVMGLDLFEIEWLRRRILADLGGVLEVANHNSERQIVLSGDKQTVAAAVQRAEADGALAQYLPVAAAAHSPLMADVLQEWGDALAAVPLAPLLIPVLSGIDARIHVDPAECAELLVRSLLLPVRWADAVTAAAGERVPAIWDAGPAHVLRNLGRRIGQVPWVERFGITSAV
jgi:[acyl-carrier-protein] S-malonyltransferase